MKTPKEILTQIDLSSLRTEAYSVIENMQIEAYNQAVRDCHESATAYITQESVNGGKVAKVNSESILKNLKK